MFLSVLLSDFGGSLERFFGGKTSEVHERLLAIEGIGPEMRLLFASLLSLTPSFSWGYSAHAACEPLQRFPLRYI